MQQRQLPSPLLIPVLCWCAGIAVSRLANPPAWMVWGLTGFALGGALFLRRIRPYFVLLLCLALGAWRLQLAQRPSALDIVLRDKDHIQQEAHFRVRQLLSREAQLYQIRLEKLNGVRARETLLLYCESELMPGRGYHALLEIIPGRRDPVLDNWPASHRAYIRQGLKKLSGRRDILPLAAWRVRLLASLERKLGADADFAKALLFSDTSAKSMYRDQLTRSGMIHLIVVSGLHIWFIYGMCMVLLNALLPRRLGEAVFLVLIVFYAALNHWSPAVVRAALMIGLFVLARWRGIPLGGAQLLALSLLIITAVSPLQLFDIGLQLSYLCIGVILLGLPKITWIKEQRLRQEKLRLGLNRTLDLLLLNVGVGIAVMPLTMWYFGSASLNGIVGNLLGIPLSGALLAVSFLVLFLPAGSWPCLAFTASYRFLLRLFEHWSAWVASLPFYLQQQWLSPWRLAGSLLLVAAALYSLRRMKLERRLLPAAVLGLGLFLLPRLLIREEAGIYVFACGTADCSLARLPGGTELLVDCGPFYRNAEKSWAARTLIPWLQREEIGTLDWLVLTHLDTDHSGGFEDLALAGMLSHVIVSDEILFDPKWDEWAKAGLLADLNVHVVRDTVSVWLEGARLKFLHPDRSFIGESSNSGSLLFRLDAGGKRILFTGDADVSAEEHLLESYPLELQADYLKAAHHGSRSSSSREFVRAVLPDEVWITASRRNRWDFPHPEPLAAFRLYASRIRSTAEGTIYQSLAQKD